MREIRDICIQTCTSYLYISIQAFWESVWCMAFSGSLFCRYRFSSPSMRDVYFMIHSVMTIVILYVFIVRSRCVCVAYDFLFCCFCFSFVFSIVLYLSKANKKKTLKKSTIIITSTISSRKISFTEYGIFALLHIWTQVFLIFLRLFGCCCSCYICIKLK